jgi:long-chain fatty acid transport protein
MSCTNHSQATLHNEYPDILTAVLKLNFQMKSLLALFLVTLSSLSAFAAEGLRSLPESAEALGMIGGRIALLDDPSVVRQNPASMGLIGEASWQTNFQAWHGDTDFRSSSTGKEDSMILNWKLLGSMFGTMPLSDKLTVGLGLSVPFGLSINWPRDGAFRYAAPFDATLQTIAINPAISYQLSKKLSFGIGADIIYSRLQLDQAFPWFAVVPGSAPGEVTMQGDGWGLGAYMGINFEPAVGHRFSLTGRLPVTVKYKGDATWTERPAAVAGAFATSTTFRSEIQYPGSIGLGYAWLASQRFALGLSGEWIQNSTHDDLPLNVGKNQALIGGPGLDLNWKDSWSMGMGLQYKVTDTITFRSGYQYSTSPLRDETYIPSVPANDRHMFSLGLGYRKGKNSIDFSYTLMPMESRTVKGSTSTPAGTFDGRYSFLWHVLALSVTRRF